MLMLEDYIAKRKKEDNINEFNQDCRQDNLRTCVNYVFEYFNTYLNISIFEHQTILKDENVEKYRQALSKYDSDVQDWLVSIYIEDGKQTNKSIIPLLVKDQFFFLTSSEREFRELSYDVYAKVVKKIPSVKGQAEMVHRFIKEFHRTKSYENEFEKMDLPLVIVKWLDEVRNKYRVDVALFCAEWASYFFHNPHLWPYDHKIKSWSDLPGFEYNYDYQQKSNLLKLDELYKRLTKKVFLRGHQQDIEFILMYYWLHDIESDTAYWNKYVEKVLPAVEAKHADSDD